MLSSMRIAHLTSAHPRLDTRIYQKMCLSLANRGHTVDLVVADGQGDYVADGVRIIDAGGSVGRAARILNAPTRVFNQAIDLDADLYHLHDPELLPIGLKLKKLGKRVIFDSHEDVPRQMLSKSYLIRPLRYGVAIGLRRFEAWACKQFDGVIAATPFICRKFLAINPNSIAINNFPRPDELVSVTRWDQKQPVVCYVGGITKVRGIFEVTQAFGVVRSEVRLKLLGEFGEDDLQSKLRALPGWSRVDVLGFADRRGVREILGRSMAGLVTFLPAPNHIDAQPNKMFEYMSAGIPVIASDFPLWREIICGDDCGLLVNPLDPAQIAAAIDHIVTRPDDAERMGRNGRRAVLDRYNWLTEEAKLLSFYERILRR
jgi:glycosyltransferase involved in cell wall biosynthesis